MTGNFKGKNGPLLIAEIGGNHEGDFHYAKKLVRLAVASEVDCVKLQIYTGDTLVSSIESPDRNKHFKRFELTRDQHVELASLVAAAGKKYVASVWNTDAIDWIDPYISIFKIGSGDLTAYPIIRSTAIKKKPIILSTGLSTEAEVIESVNFIQSVDKAFTDRDMLAVLQCTSMYPIPLKDANLNVMARLRELTSLTIGYSDHTEGTKALRYATAMGAEILEFHFTDSREGKTFRDHKVSLTPDEIAILVGELKEIYELQGNPVKSPTSIEIDNGHVQSFRRSVYPAMDLKAGDVLTAENLEVLRPCSGIDARDFNDLLGKKLKVPVVKHQKLSWDNIASD